MHDVQRREWTIVPVMIAPDIHIAQPIDGVRPNGGHCTLEPDDDNVQLKSG